MKRFLFTGIFAVIISLAAMAQQNASPCLTDYMTNEFFKDNTAQAQQLKEQFFALQQEKLSHGYAKKSGALRIIPVVFHVIHTYGPENISREQIVDQIRVLNEDFQRKNADAGNTRSIFQADAATCDVEFRLATIDPSGNCTDGVTRHYSTLTEETRDEVKTIIQWDPKKYLNIWVVKSIRSQGSDVGTTLGFAYLPWSLQNWGTSGTKNVDGIVVRADYVGTIGTSSPSKAGRTLTHEVGHYLGLFHPFEGGCGSSCSNSGDRICDTPPVSTPSFGCNKSANTCSNDSPNELDQVENYMDYADGSCQNMFTWGQKTSIDMVLSNSSYRSVLVSNSNLIATGTSVIASPTCKPVADFTTVQRTVCSGKSTDFADVSWGGKVTSRSWSFPSGNPSSSTDSLATVTYSAPGTYNVTLVVTNSAGQAQVTRSQIIVVKPSVSSNKAPFSEGFESATFPPTDWTMTGGTKNWERTTVSSSGGSASVRAVINASTAVDEMFALNLPILDINPAGTPGYLNFKVAYAQRPNVTSDRLRVLYSTDCGNSWTLLSQRTGTNLASAPNYSGTSFVPSGAGEWKLISLSLSPVNPASRSNIIFRFEAYSNGGNNIYVDDINISSSQNPTTVIAPVNKEALGLSLYPNPSSQSSTLSFSLPETANVDMKVVDITGRVVKDFGVATLQPGNHNYTISKLDNNLTDGIYFVKLLVNNQLYTGKLIFIQ